MCKLIKLLSKVSKYVFTMIVPQKKKKLVVKMCKKKLRNLKTLPKAI